MAVTQGTQFLTDIVSPYLEIDYFLHNTYRVLEMPVTASMKELTKRGNAIEMAQQTGADVPKGKQPIFRIKEKLEEDEDNKAFLRLGNPDHRMLDIFFWFWPMAENGPDEALDLLQANSEQQAIDIWLKNIHTGGVSGVCKHNLAVLHTIKALHTGTGSGDMLPLSVEVCWSEAGKFWNLALEDEQTWTKYIEYIELVGDARVTTGYNRRVRASLPTIIAALIGNVAVKKVSDGKVAETKKLIGIAQNTGFDSDLINQGLVLAGKPLEERARMFLTLTKNNIDTNLSNAEPSIQAMVDGCRPLIEPLTLLYDNSRKAQSLFDTLAETGHEYSMRFARHTDEWGKTLTFLKIFRGWARSKSTISTLDEAIKDAGENAEAGNFYYSANYYAMPEEVLNQANLARKALDQGKAADAVNRLETLLRDHSTNPLVSGALKLSLSFCLVRKANMEFAKVTENLDADRPVITQIMRRWENYSGEIARGSTAATMGTVQRDYQYLNCAACGGSLSRYNSYATITYKEQKFVICGNCSGQDEVVRQGQQRAISGVLVTNHSDLKKALAYNPNNKTAAENLKSLKQIANNIGLSLDGTPAKPAPSTPSYSRPPVTQPKKANSSGCATTFWVVAGIIFLIYLCSMINN